MFGTFKTFRTSGSCILSTYNKKQFKVWKMKVIVFSVNVAAIHYVDGKTLYFMGIVLVRSAQ